MGPNGNELTFNLTVTDADGFEHSDTVNILVTETGAAGPGQNLGDNEGGSVGGSACFLATSGHLK